MVTAHYDNSPKNEHLMQHHHHADSDHAVSDNLPKAGPDKEVHFRDANQSWDEMFSPIVQFSSTMMPIDWNVATNSRGTRATRTRAS